MASKFGKAPWEDVPPEDQLFVLITGANSGIGLGIGERLIDEFLATRSATSHLILLPTTRAASKSRETIRTLYAHAAKTAATSSRWGEKPGSATARIHVLSLELDLCDIRAVYILADRMCNDTVSNPDKLGDEEGGLLRRVRIPRLDGVVCNAAYGGWSGLSYLWFFWQILTTGLVQSVTWPYCKTALPTRLLNAQKAYQYPAEPALGEVFSACVFGHYLFAHKLLPLLSRPAGSTIAPSRIVWSSSIEALRDFFDINDLQALHSTEPYESTKRLTDILSLTCTLPSVCPYSSSFATLDSEKEDLIAPKMYVTHPGIVRSTLFPLPWWLFWAYGLALAIARWLGSPWHTTDTYSGGKSPVYLILSTQASLDAQNAERIKWGSSSDHTRKVDVKKTEVEGWGWQGRVEDMTVEEDGVVGTLRKTIGRKLGAVDTTAGDIIEFEEEGVEVWKKMEELRREWEELLSLE